MDSKYVLAFCFLTSHSLSDMVIQRVDWTAMRTGNRGLLNTTVNLVATAQDAFFKVQKSKRRDETNRKLILQSNCYS